MEEGVEQGDSRCRVGDCSALHQGAGEGRVLTVLWISRRVSPSISLFARRWDTYARDAVCGAGDGWQMLSRTEPGL